MTAPKRRQGALATAMAPPSHVVTGGRVPRLDLQQAARALVQAQPKEMVL